MASVGPRLQLWDVRDVEAHVRVIVDSWLREWNARLDATKRDLLVRWLIRTCWLLSGLKEDGRTLRPGYAPLLTITYPAPRWSSVYGLVEQRLFEPPPYNLQGEAVAAGAKFAAWFAQDGSSVEVEIVERRPRGAYDPSFGISFSTYSRRTLTRRIIDWYREEFKDRRYGPQELPLSLEQLGRSHRDELDVDEGSLGRLEVIDVLNRNPLADVDEEAWLNVVTR